MLNTTVSPLANNNIDVFHLGQQSKSVELFTVIVSVLTIAVGLVGNVLLTLTIAVSASLRTPMNTFVLSIGLVDLLTSVLLLPLRVTTERKVLANDEIDPMLFEAELFVRTFTDIMRLFLMMSLSVERYQSIAKPLQVSKVQAKRRAAVMSGVTWTASVLLSVISVRYFCNTVLHQSCYDTTSSVMNKWGDLEVFVELPLSLLSILVIAISYGMIVMILKNQRKKMTGHLKPKANQVVPIGDTKITESSVNSKIKMVVCDTTDKPKNLIDSTEHEVKQQEILTSTVGFSDTGGRSVVKDEVIVDAGNGNMVVGDNCDELIMTVNELDMLRQDTLDKNNIEISQIISNSFLQKNNGTNTGPDNNSSDKNYNICNNNNNNLENDNLNSNGFVKVNEKITFNSPCSLLIINSVSDLVEEKIKNISGDSKSKLQQYVSNVINAETTSPVNKDFSHASEEAASDNQATSTNNETYAVSEKEVQELNKELTDHAFVLPIAENSKQTSELGKKGPQTDQSTDNAELLTETVSDDSLCDSSSNDLYKVQSCVDGNKPEPGAANKSRGTTIFSNSSAIMKDVPVQISKELNVHWHSRELGEDKHKKKPTPNVVPIHHFCAPKAHKVSFQQTNLFNTHNKRESNIVGQSELPHEQYLHESDIRRQTVPSCTHNQQHSDILSQAELSYSHNQQDSDIPSKLELVYTDNQQNTYIPCQTELKYSHSRQVSDIHSQMELSCTQNQQKLDINKNKSIRHAHNKDISTTMSTCNSERRMSVHVLLESLAGKIESEVDIHNISDRTHFQISFGGELDSSRQDVPQNCSNYNESLSSSFEHSSGYSSSKSIPEQESSSKSKSQHCKEQLESHNLSTKDTSEPEGQQLKQYNEEDNATSMPKNAELNTSEQSTYGISMGTLDNSGIKSTTEIPVTLSAVPDIPSTKESAGDKHIEVVEMDGTVHMQIVNTSSAAPIDGAVCLMNPRNREQGKRRVELKATLKVGLLVCCFVCLWMPLPILVCILRGSSTFSASVKTDMLSVFSALAASTAAVDPILYGLLNRQIRSALQAGVLKIKRKISNYCTK